MQTTFPVNRPLHSGHTLPQKAPGLNQPHTLAQLSTQPQFSGDDINPYITNDNRFLFKYMATIASIVLLTALGTIAQNRKAEIVTTLLMQLRESAQTQPLDKTIKLQEKRLQAPEAARENQPQTAGKLPEAH